MNTRKPNIEDPGAGHRGAECPPTDRILLWTEGALDENEARIIADHVASCHACTEVVGWIGTLSGTLRSAGASDGAARTGEHPAGELLAAFADGSLDASRAADIEEHIVRCGACLSEVADLWALSGPEIADASDVSVASVLERLKSEAGTAVVRWVERSLTLVRDFAAARAEEGREVLEGLAVSPEPAPARGGFDRARLHWTGDEGIVLDGVVRTTASGGIAMTGRVTLKGDPAVAVSIALGTSDGTRGPESLDARGRFGPWPLSEGRNTLRLSGVPGAAGAVELAVIVSRNAGD